MCHIRNKFANWMIDRINLVKSSAECFQILLEFAIHASRVAARTVNCICHFIGILVRFGCLVFRFINDGTLSCRLLLLLLQFLNLLFFDFFVFLLESSLFVFQLLFGVLFFFLLLLDFLGNFFTEILNVDVFCLHLDDFFILMILFLPLK